MISFTTHLDEENQVTVQFNGQNYQELVPKSLNRNLNEEDRLRVLNDVTLLAAVLDHVLSQPEKFNHENSAPKKEDDHPEFDFVKDLDRGVGRN